MVRIKGAAASGHRTDLLRRVRSATDGGELDVAEARFLVKLYERNELALSRDELVNYVALNLSSSFATSSKNMSVLPRNNENDDERALVSVIVPTTGHRHAFHEFLYACFRWQTYPRKEMLLLDTAKEPSSFFTSLQDARVRYFHEPNRLDKSTGAKRNELANLAAGTIIAHFDDDDCYAPAYLERMVRALQDADFVKLSSWLWLDTERLLRDDRQEDCVAWFDSSAKSIDTQYSAAGWHSRKWGYGFTYVYRKSLLLNVEFPQTFFGEDYDFFMKIRLRFRCVAFQDNPTDAQVIHLIHNNSSSVVFSRHKVFSLSDLDFLFCTHPRHLVNSHLLEMRRAFLEPPLEL